MLSRLGDTVLFQAVVSLINHITIITMILTGAALIREREHGTPVESQPDWLQTLTLVLPSRHYIAFGQEIIYKGAGLAVVWPAFAAVSGLGLALLAASLALFRRSVATDR